jgi:hypothetical protein
MVRLVFRPYTQVRRSICTLESLRTSTRVSPGFVLLKHSSPSFGSQHVCSHSNLSFEESWSVDSAACGLLPRRTKVRLHFHYALGGEPRALAHMLDSLVRVSRRVDESHFVRVPRSNDSTNHHAGDKTSLEQSRKPNLSTSTSASRTTLTPIGSISAISGTFNSLFKVLFIFPSRYLFAIGLPPIFSFRWNLPPT